MATHMSLNKREKKHANLFGFPVQEFNYESHNLYTGHFN